MVQAVSNSSIKDLEKQLAEAREAAVKAAEYVKYARENDEMLYWKWMSETGARHASYYPTLHAEHDQRQADAKVKDLEDIIEAQTGVRPAKPSQTDEKV